MEIRRVLFTQKDLIELRGKLESDFFGESASARGIYKVKEKGCFRKIRRKGVGRLINSTPANLISKQKKYNYSRASTRE